MAKRNTEQQIADLKARQARERADATVRGNLETCKTLRHKRQTAALCTLLESTLELAKQLRAYDAATRNTDPVQQQLVSDDTPSVLTQEKARALAATEGAA